jgi:hypothetical protein
MQDGHFYDFQLLTRGKTISFCYSENIITAAEVL